MIIDVLGTVRKLFLDLVALGVVLLALVVVSFLAPVLLIVLPQVLVARDPQGDFFWLAQIFVFVTPVAAGLWLAALSQIHSKRLWRSRGKTRAEWREAHGGYVRGQVKSAGYMFLGILGSAVCEFLFIAAFKQVPYGMFDVSRFALWFALFPFAAFAPVILLLYKRRNYDEPIRLKADDPEWLAYLETLQAEARTRQTKTGDDNFLKSMGTS